MLKNYIDCCVSTIMKIEKRKIILITEDGQIIKYNINKDSNYNINIGDMFLLKIVDKEKNPFKYIVEEKINKNNPLYYFKSIKNKKLMDNFINKSNKKITSIYKSDEVSIYLERYTKSFNFDCFYYTLYINDIVALTCIKNIYGYFDYKFYYSLPDKFFDLIINKNDDEVQELNDIQKKIDEIFNKINI